MVAAEVLSENLKQCMLVDFNPKKSSKQYSPKSERVQSQDGNPGSMVPTATLQSRKDIA